MDYQHVVYIEERDEMTYLRIDRLFDGSRRDFVMELEIASVDGTEHEKWEALERVATWLGKNICVDAPALRSKLGF